MDDASRESIRKLTESEHISDEVKVALISAEYSMIASQESNQIEIEKLRNDLTSKKWNTPLAAAAAGLITLFATYVIDAERSAQNSKENLTLEQLKAEISESETRLKQQFLLAGKEADAATQSAAAEREFQYNLVREQLSENLPQEDRARVLLFLAKSGIVSTLNVEYLEALASDQLASDPGTSLIPFLSSSRRELGWTPLSAVHNLGVSAVSRSVGRISVSTPESSFKCTGVFVGSRALVTADYCAPDGVNAKITVGSNSDDLVQFRDIYELTLQRRNEDIGLAWYEPIGDPVSALKISDPTEAIEGLPVVLVHYPGGADAQISRCDIIDVENRRIKHNCSSFAGSGGGPLISELTGAVVGIHHEYDARTGFGIAMRLSSDEIEELDP